MIIEVELHGGHVIEMDNDRLDNMELLDAIGELENQEQPSVSAMGRAVLLLLGKEGKKKLYDLYRTEDGRVPVGDISQALVELANGSGAKKS